MTQIAHQKSGTRLVESGRDDRSPPSTFPMAGRRLRRPRRPSGWLAAAIAPLAAASALALAVQFVPSYDPYGWLVWGHQTIHLALNPIGAPSWKPLAWFLTTPVSLAGTAAPTVWLILVYASALVALWLAYRLAYRLGGPFAGGTAVVALLLCHDWVLYTLTGDSEPFTTAFALGAVDRHLAGQHRLALGLGTLVALSRPEAFVVLAPYLVWLWRAEPRARVWEGVAVAAIPLLWLLPPYLATGRRFATSEPALHTGLATPSPLTVIDNGLKIVTFPVAILAVVGLVITLRRGTGRGLALALAAAPALWAATVAVMAQFGFAGLQRFILPAAAAGCVLAGAGASWILEWLRQLAHRRGRLIVGLALTLIAGVFAWRAYSSIADTSRAIADVRSRATAVHSLDRAIGEGGGARRLLACGFPTIDLGYQSTVAWRLGLAVGAVGFEPNIDVRQHTHVLLFALGREAARGAHRLLLARAGAWSIVGVRARSACFGSHA